jgi:hypothetical protein
MVAPQCRHHRAAAGARGHDGAAHRVPDIHEGQWSGGVGADALDRSAFGPERREVVADAALLHRQCCFTQVTENAAEVVLDVAHDKAIEQGHAAPSAGAGRDPSRRQEAEIFERLVERHLPLFWVTLCGRERAGDAAPAVLYRDVDRGAVVGLNRYLASQICREIGAILFAVPPSGSSARQPPDRGPRVAGAGSSAVMYMSIVLSWSSVGPSPSARAGGRGTGAAAGARARRTLAAAGGAWHPSRPLCTGTGAAPGWCSQPATRCRSGMPSMNNDGVAGPRR